MCGLDGVLVMMLDRYENYLLLFSSTRQQTLLLGFICECMLVSYSFFVCVCGLDGVLVMMHLLGTFVVCGQCPVCALG